MASTIVHSTAVYQVENCIGSNRSPAAGTGIRRDLLAVLEVPAIDDLTPGETVGFRTATAGTELPMSGSLLIHV